MYNNFTRQIPTMTPKLYGGYKRYSFNKEEDEEEIIEAPGKRTMLNRVFSPLNVGQYAVAGFAKGLVRDDLNPVVGALQGVWGANPFGQGREDWQHSFSDVLEDAGWQPESTGGKVAKGVTGMALDIFLDPMTYVSGGTLGVLKGSGKASVDIAVKGNKYILNADDLAKGLGLSLDTATDIIKASGAFKEGMVTDLALEASELVRKYNKLIGVNQKSAEVTLSLANAPLGKKIFGAAADKSKTLFTSEQVMKFGDKTFAPYFAVARDSIMGTKIGKLFNTDHLIYNLSKNNPEEVFNYFKQADVIRGMDIANADKIVEINKLGEKLLNLTPAQNKQVIELMENPKTRHKIESMVQFAETKEGIEYLDSIREYVSSAESEIDRLSTVFDGIHDLFDMKEFNESELKLAYQTLSEELENINLSYIDDLKTHEKYREALKNSNEALKHIKDREEKAKSIVTEFKDYFEKSTQRQIDIDAKKTLAPIIDNKATTHYVMQDMKPVPRTRTSYQELVDILPRPDNVSVRSYNADMKRFEDFGHIRYEPARGEEWANKLVDKYKGLGLQKYKDADGVWYVIHPEITIGHDVANKVSTIAMYGDIPSLDNKKMVDDISEYVFGQKGMIHTGIFDRDMKEIVDMIENGDSIDDIGRFIYQNKDIYSGKAQKMNQFIAKELRVYGRGTNFPTWKEYYTDRVEAFDKQISNGKPLSKQQNALLTELERVKNKRENMRASFAGVSNKEMDEIITNKANSGLDEIFRNYYEDDTLKRTGDARIDWLTYRDGTTYSMNSDEIGIFQTAMKDRIDTLSAKTSSNVAKETYQVSDNWETVYGAKDRVHKEFLNTKHKIDGKFSTLGEVQVGWGEDGIKKLKDLSPIEINDMINNLGDSGFMERTGISIEDFKVLKFNSNEVAKIDKAWNLDKVRMQFGDSGKGTSIIDPSANWIDNLTPAEKKVHDRFLNVANDILNDSQKRSLSDILNYSDESFEEFLDKVMKEANKIGHKEEAESYRKLFGESKSNTKVVSDLVEGVKEQERIINNLDEIKGYDDMYDYFFANNNNIITENHATITELGENLLIKDYTKSGFHEGIDELKVKTLEEIEQIRFERIIEANNKYRDNFDRIKSMNEDLDMQLKNIMETNQPTMDEISRLSDEIVKYQKLIDSNDAFEVYVRSSENIGDKGVDAILERVNKHVGEYILDPNKDYDDTVRDVVNELTKEFRRIGVDEVDIGSLSEGQLEGMLNRYLPHILTPEAKEIVKSNKKVQDDLKKVYNFGADYGFGRQFNPHASSRTLDKIVLNGETIYNPNINQLNEYFKPLLEGNKMFNESVAELYLARAFTNNKLMYDNEYMEKMVTIFGKEWTGVAEEGYDSVMNYGKLKQFSNNYARHSTNLDKSDMISNYLSNEYTKATINAEISKRKLQSQYANMEIDQISSEVYSEFINKYMKDTFTPDVSRKMYQDNLSEFLNGSNLRESLEELHLPLSHINNDQYDKMGLFNKDLKTRFTNNIKKSFRSLTNMDASEMDIDSMYEVLDNAIRSGDIPEYKVERFEGLINKIDKFKDIPDAQIGMMQSSIVSKTNQARELQIIKDNNKLLQLYDKVTHFMKLNQTTVLPGFHVKNKQGNTFRSWLGAGGDILDLDMQKGAIKSINSKGEFAEEAFRVGEEVFTWDRLYKEADNLGVMDVQGFAKEVGATDSSKGLLKGLGIPGKFDPTNTSDFFWYRAGTKVGNWTESQDRLLHFAARVKQGMNFREAAEVSQKFLFDYSDLTFFEQNVMKRIMPYYTWLRKNTPLQVEMLLDHPDKFRNVSKVLGGIEGMTNQSERIDKRWANDFAREWIQLPFKITNEDGREEPVMLNPNLPISSFNDIPDPSNIGGTLRNYANMTNPIIKIPTELLINKHTFFDTPIVNKASPFTQKAGQRIEHVLNQFSLYPAGKGLVTKKGVNRALHAGSALSGVKAVSYDYDKFKAMKRTELEKKRKSTKTNSNDYLNAIQRNLGGW